MKNIQNQTVNHNIKFNANKKRAENKDDLDSRNNEEQHLKGDHVTHNNKLHHNKPRSKKK
ncbi:MAG: hypothetical protein ABIR18_02915 [Chitinophagaceae bacterium]